MAAGEKKNKSLEMLEARAREVNPDSIRGGQLWCQDSFPFHTRYVTVVPGPDDFALLSDPRKQGSCVCTEEGGKWTYTPEELAKKFERLNYSCKGQLHMLVQPLPLDMPQIAVQSRGCH